MHTESSQVEVVEVAQGTDNEFCREGVKEEDNVKDQTDHAEFSVGGIVSCPSYIFKAIFYHLF